jgi:hypothetical protein
MPSSSGETVESVESEEEEEEIIIPEESNISKTLSESTTKTVVLLVLCLLVMQNVCDTKTYTDVVYVHKQALLQIVALYDLQYWQDYQKSYFNFIEETMTKADGKYPLIYFNAADPYSDNYTTSFVETRWEPYVDDLRPEEYTVVHAFSESGK